MYLDHWGLERSPFSSGLDVRTFYASPVHEEALARLEYLATAGRRLGVLLGSSGMGKSLVLRVSAGQLRRRGMAVALVDATGASTRELLWQATQELGATPCFEDDVPRLWRRLADRLTENRMQRIDTVLLVDDADHAGPDLMTQLGRLTHLDPDPRAQWTIVLAGRPAAVANWSQSFRELIDLRIDLSPWHENDTVGFIQTSLVDAGRFDPIFDDDALAVLHELSGGVPRQVVRLAEFALLAGAGAELQSINAQTIRSAFVDVQWTAVS